MTAVPRAVLGFCAAAISVLVFHQGMWALLHAAGLMPPPFPTDPVGPLGVPRIYDLCFWGGLYGIVFGLLFPVLPKRGLWVQGLVLGLIAEVVGLYVVPELKGLPLWGGGVPLNIIRGVLINGFWGIGVGLLAPFAFNPIALRSSRYART
jgi:hypothetical protein